VRPDLLKNHAAPAGEDKDGIIWRTGVYHDAVNSRPEFSQIMRDKEKNRK